jgi:hypothetical protein
MLIFVIAIPSVKQWYLSFPIHQTNWNYHGLVIEMSSLTEQHSPSTALGLVA